MNKLKEVVSSIVIPFSAMAAVIAFFMVLIKLLVVFWNWLEVFV